MPACGLHQGRLGARDDVKHGIAVERVSDGSFVSTAHGDHYAPTVVRRGYRPCVWRLLSISVRFEVRNVSRVSFLNENAIASGAAKYEVCRFRDPVPGFCHAEPEGEPLYSGVRIAIQAMRRPPQPTLQSVVQPAGSAATSIPSPR